MGLQWEDLDQQKFLMQSTGFILALDLFLYPADLLTTRLQADRFMSHENVRLVAVVQDIVRREGLKGLFRGFWVNTVGSFPGQFIYYVGYEYAHSVLRLNGKLDVLSHAMAGVIAEAMSAVSYLPTDIVTQRLQTHSGISFLPKRYQTGSTLSICKHILKTEGLKGFFRGYVPYLAVFGPGSAIWWAVYESSKASFECCFDHSQPANHSMHFTPIKAVNYLISGSLAGVLSCLVTNPLDVARTRLQLLEFGDGLERKTIRGGFISLLQKTFREEGMAGLYKGVKPRLWVRAPGSAFALLGYEYLKSKSLKSNVVNDLRDGGLPGSEIQHQLLS